MAGNTFPADGPRSRASAAEVAFYEALRRQLPDGWIAWHSLRLRANDAWEGEGDFVLADPRRGLMVVEVKGGAIELRGGRWLQNGREMKRPPRDQAHTFVRRLADALRDRGAEVPPYGVACAFPDVDFSDGPANGDLDGVAFGRRELAWLGQVLPTVMERALPPARPRGAGWIRTVTDLWGVTWAPHVRLADRAEDAARRAVELDHEQLALLDFAGSNPRALVEGGAGTGKTVVAREICVRRARAGRRVLYTCFTDALARAVDRSLEVERSAGADVRAVSIRQYAAALLGAAGQKAGPEDHDFWEEASLRAACDALPPAAERPGTVVVDEAQDLTEGDWTLVEALAQDRELWLFTDPRQRFWDERVLPAGLLSGMTRLVLRAQHRNPPAIEAFAALYATAGSDRGIGSAAAGERPGGAAAGGDALRIVVVPESRVLDRVRHEVDTLVKEGAALRDIAVLTLTGKTKSRLLANEKLGSHFIARADAPDAPGRIIVDTFLRMKGLERPFVIVTELIHGSKMKYETRMHIALTRATVKATIVCDEGAVAADARLAEL